MYISFLIVPINAFPAIVQLYKVWAEVANSDKPIISWYLRSSSRLKSVTQIVVLSAIPTFPLSTHYLPLSLGPSFQTINNVYIIVINLIF